MQSDPKSAPTLAAPLGLEAKASLPSHDQPDALLGTVVDGRYLIERVLGEGGMGIVYRARHRVIEKRVAIKVLRREMARDQEMTDRFLQEAQTASKIGNGHIVEITDFGVMPDGATYFVMEYLDGESLTGVLEKLRSLPLERILHIAKQIARGLAAAHAAGIVHRDLKPDNVMLLTRGDDADFVKILDFGIAKVGTAASKITRAGSIFGTPHYMSPEQAAGTPVDARTDIYALGVIMYEMATGTVPFDAEGFMGILSQHLYKVPVPLLAASKRTDVPASFEVIVMKCLSKTAEGRYLSMDALVDDIDAVQRGVAPVAVLDRGDTPNYFEPPTGTSGVALAASPASTKTLSRPIVGFALSAFAALVVTIGVVFSRDNSGKKGPIAEAQSAAAAAEPAALAVAQPAAPAAPKEKLVLISVDPLDARVFENGKDLGTPPVALRLKDGETRTVAVKRAGYTTSTATFAADALVTDEVKRVVRLTSTAPLRTVKPASKPAGAKPVITDHDPDPWKRTAR